MWLPGLIVLRHHNAWRWLGLAPLGAFLRFRTCYLQGMPMPSMGLVERLNISFLYPNLWHPLALYVGDSGYFCGIQNGNRAHDIGRSEIKSGPIVEGKVCKENIQYGFFWGGCDDCTMHVWNHHPGPRQKKLWICRKLWESLLHALISVTRSLRSQTTPTQHHTKFMSGSSAIIFFPSQAWGLKTWQNARSLVSCRHNHVFSTPQAVWPHLGFLW